MILLIILRIMFLLKWSLQIFGIILWLGINNSTAAFSSLAFLIIIEAIMWSVIWICNGVSAIKARQRIEDLRAVPVFNTCLISVSFYAYVILLTSIVSMIGCFFCGSILSAGIALFLCFYKPASLKSIVKNYLEFNV